MFSSLKGKKLLILGGVRMACDYVRRAQKMGATVYVADYEKDSPAKKVADHAILLNALDVDAVVEFCQKEKIDGITTGYVDILLPACYEACRRLGLPYYATKEMIEVSTDKVAFKDMCNKHGVPVPKTYSVTKENYCKISEHLEYPVFVKPMDASGSRGASVCKNQTEFINQFETALSFSKKQEVVVEEYLQGTDFIMDFILVNGKTYVLSMFDRKVCADRPSAINHANLLIAPSHKIDKYLSDIHPKVEKMFSEMGFKDGLIFLQGYIDGEKITFFEMGCRLGGTFPNIDEHFIGINPMDMLIHHAVTGKMLNEEYCKCFNARFDGKGGIINLLIKGNGKAIVTLDGFDEIEKMPEVVNCIRYMGIGESFAGEKITDKPVAIIYVAAKNFEDFKRVVNEIYAKARVLDENGESLLMTLFDPEKLDKENYR